MFLKHPASRGSIFEESATILDHQHFDGEQHILRLHAPVCSAKATAGQFVHLQCDPLLPLRRPLSIMRSNPSEQWIELLYKQVGYGTGLLANRQTGDSLPMLGPIGNQFQLNTDKPVRILIGGGVGIPPMIFLAETIAGSFPEDINNTLVIMGSEAPFPFTQTTSSINVAGINENISSAITDIEQLGIASRLASLQDYEGCFRGYAPDLARQHLKTFDPETLQKVEIYSCGPHPMLSAVKNLANDFDVPCSISLEENMACAVGGCAGCVVEVDKNGEKAMKRVCVDGPVFDGNTVSL